MVTASGSGHASGSGSRAGAESSTTRPRPQLGHLATWAVSSHKYGFGVDNLKDENENTFWQSEGPQPHMIDLSFPRRVFISAVSVLTSHPRDDSYTPSKLSVRCGTTVHDLREVRLCEFQTPDGWQHIALRPMDASGNEEEGPAIPAYHIRVAVLANHLNGKDTHVRGIRVYGVPPGEGEGGRVGDGRARDGKGGAGGGAGVGVKSAAGGGPGGGGFTSEVFRTGVGLR